MAAIDTKAINIYMSVTGPFSAQMAQRGAAVQTFGTQANAGMMKAQAGMARFGVATKIATIGAVAVAIGLALSAKAAIDFESSFAGVRKTIDTTEVGFQRLAAGIRLLSTEIPINVNELNKIAELGGQLGVGAEDLLAFTETIALIGVTTTLSTDEAALGFARLDNIMQLNGQSFDRIGSAIVGLGNNFAATEDEILNFALRIAPIGAVVGLTTDEILAIATAFTSVGVRAERGGTAVQKTLIAITEAAQSGGIELAIFAKVAGLTVDEFAKLVEQDPAASFRAFIKGLDGVTEAGDNVFAVLDAVGLGNTRVIQSLLALSEAGDTLNDTLGQGNDFWQDNNALTEEAAKRFETTASKLILTKNRIQDLAISIGGDLLPLIADFALGISSIIDWLRNLDPAIRNTTFLVGGLTTALLIWKTHPIILGFTLVAGAIMAIGRNAAAVERRVKVLRDILALDFPIAITPDDLSVLIGDEPLEGLFGAGFKKADVRKAIFGTEADYQKFLKAARSEFLILREDLQGESAGRLETYFAISDDPIPRALQEIAKRRRDLDKIRVEESEHQAARNRAAILGIKTQSAMEQKARSEASRSDIRAIMRARQGIEAELAKPLEAALIEPKFIDDIGDALSTYVETVQEAFAEVEDSILGNLDAWAEFDEGLDAAFDDIIATLELQIEAMGKFETLLAELDLRPDIEAFVRGIYATPELMSAFVRDFEAGGVEFLTSLGSLLDEANELVFQKWTRELEKVEFVAGEQFLADIAAVANAIIDDEENTYNPAQIWLGLITQALDGEGPAVRDKILGVLLSAFGDEDEVSNLIIATKDQISSLLAMLAELEGEYEININVETTYTDYPLRHLPSTDVDIRRIARAHGGFAFANKPYIVGEAGRELFVPFNSGTIIPNKNLGGDSNKTVNITIVRSETNDLAGDISTGLTRAAIAEQIDLIGAY